MAFFLLKQPGGNPRDPDFVFDIVERESGSFPAQITKHEVEDVGQVADHEHALPEPIEVSGFVSAIGPLGHVGIQRPYATRDAMRKLRGQIVLATSDAWSALVIIEDLSWNRDKSIGEALHMTVKMQVAPQGVTPSVTRIPPSRLRRGKTRRSRTPTRAALAPVDPKAAAATAAFVPSIENKMSPAKFQEVI